MVNNLTAKGRKMVTIVDPHIKKDGGYYIHTECQSNGFYIKDPSGSDYEGTFKCFFKLIKFFLN